jgi:cyclopropane-fatty-acyl-phospholipid synthase
MTPNPPNINKLQIPGEAKIILNAFSKITFGEVTITTPENFIHYFTGNKSGPHVNLKIKNWDICREILKKSDIGLAETYLNGLWESDSVSDLIEFSILNEHALMSAFKGSWLKILYYRIIHNKRENTKEGSKKNIAAHYDLGNDFYQLWLDKTMSYSSAMFNGDYSKPHSKAQEDKYQSMLDLIKPASNDHILEIGCGWGGFLEYAGKKGYKVTGITISKAQYEFAIKRIEALGLSELINIKICDYRDIEATFPDKFDHAVSIEMIEAVG